MVRAILFTAAWIVCAIVAYSNHTLLILLLWSIPIPAVMVPGLIWMRRRFYYNRAYIFRVSRPRWASHQSRYQRRQAA